MTALLDAIRSHAARAPNALALDDGSDETLTYAALAKRVEAEAILASARYAHGRPVALQMDHGIGQCLRELALLEAGFPILSLPKFFTEEQRDGALAACGAQAVLGDGDREEPLAAVPGVPLPAGTARITFTSGSTGSPKGVCLSAPHLLTVAASVVAAIGSEHAGRHLALLPPGILLETVAGFFPTLLAGGTYVCPRQDEIGLAQPFRPDFAVMVRAVADHRITSLILVPEYLAGLVGAMEVTGERLPRLTLVAVGGARTSLALIARARAVGLPLRQGYGLTECGSVAALQDAGCEADGSVGKPLPHIAASIAPDGEILLAGPLCLGVIGGAAPSHPLHTGDIGRIDDAGRLWVEGRKSALIVTSFGRNISPEWVEEALLAQPAIAQAMVWGDGSAYPRAFVTPAFPAADLSSAVAAANATLPEYAQVASWSEVGHFTPANGLLTGNGRLRRAAILARWEQPTFFDTLEAATNSARMAFLATPQVRAGLAGAISRRAYVDYLAQAFHHVSHTVPLMQEARAQLSHRPELMKALDDYIAEETGHEEWILNDIAAAGGNAAVVRQSAPHPATAAMVAHAYHTIRDGNAAAFFGMVYVLESISVALASQGASAVATNLGLPADSFTYLTSHGDLDVEHLQFFASLVNGHMDAEDRSAIVAMAREIFTLYGGIFASIELDDRLAAA